MNKTIATILLTSATLLSTLNAQDTEQGVYVGFQSSGFTSHGISAKMDLSDKLAAQGIVGFFGNVSNYSVRGLYKFKQQDHLSLYGYGSVGMWAWNNAFYDENVLGFGGGAGVSYDLRGLDSEFIPLFVNLELGLNVVNFNHYNYGGIGLGSGIEYKF